ncbi:MAG TPA: rhomboid family intramembrane serine protease [Polyangiaceae bacterium]|jgi:membrane associated rhomboid family serine protease|nr:rhomboid family intramembrane serine protease [Polyangiaceae bacterium]
MLPIRDHLPTRTPAIVNYAIIAANLVVFVLEASLAGGADSVERWALVPARLVADPAAAAPTLLTHMFLHGGFSHVAGNMLFLWIFGDNVEDALGHARYALFYLACGLTAAFAQVAMSPHSAVPMLGASGAIAGVLAAYGLLYPRSPITVVNPIPILWFFWGLFIYLPAWLVIVEFFLVNLWNALQPSSGGGGVAFMAHVGGFLAGLVLLPLLRTHGPVDYDRWERLRTPRRAA